MSRSRPTCPLALSLPSYTKERALYVAECPELGTVSQGATIEEAVANLKEATELYLEEFPPENRSRPLVTVFEARYA